MYDSRAITEVIGNDFITLSSEVRKHWKKKQEKVKEQ